MKRLLFLLLVPIVSALATTQIQDTIYMADGSTASGSLTIDFPYHCTGPANKTVVASNIPVVLDATGKIDVNLEPNDTCNSTYYLVTYDLDNGSRIETYQKYWIVPTSGSPLEIEDVETASVSPPSSQIPLSQLNGGTTKGDLIAYTGTSFTRFGAGADGKALVGDSGEATGLNWATVVANPVVGLLKFEGATSAYPALKRNAGGLDCRLADDSAYCSFFEAGVFITPTSGGFNFGSYSKLRSDADGNITLQNFAQTDFGLLKLGGTTSSFPALKRSTTVIQARLADDSAYATFAGSLSVPGTAILSASGAASTVPNKSGLSASIPATCGVAQTYFKTDATAGLNLFGCTSTDTWTLLGGAGGGAGDVIGPSSATDDAIARFDTTTGKLLQNGLITIGDTGILGLPDGVKQTFNPDGTTAGLNFGSQAGDPSALANGDVWYNSSTNKFRCYENGAAADCISSAGGAPSDATYITQTANGTLSAEQALGALATGIVKNTTTTGVLSIAVAADIGLLSPTLDNTDASVEWEDAADLGATGALSIDVVAPAEMADADHGDVAWVSGVASVQAVDEAAVTAHVAAIDHDSLLNFVPGEHVLHSGVTLTAGKGLTGGGDISASRTVDFIYSDTIAGNPPLAIRETVFTSAAAGGGLVYEGSVADAFEGLFRFPDVTGADATYYFAMDASEVTDLEGTGLAIAAGTLGCTDAAADDSTKGCATFDATRFSAVSGNIDIASVAGITGANEDNVGDDDLGALQNVTETGLTDNDLLTYVTDHWENQTLAEAGIIEGRSNLTTAGAVPYVSASGTLNQDATVFFWDSGNDYLGVGTNSPSYTGHFVYAGPGTWNPTTQTDRGLLVEVGGTVSSTNTDWIDVVEGITGTVKIPAGATVGGDGAHGAGVAGYAESTSPNVGPVGIYGRGVSLRSAAADMNVWGGNVVGSVPATFQADILHGFEVDTDIRGTVNTIQGLKVIGAGGGTVSGSGYAIFIDDMQDSDTPWDFGLFTVEGAVDAGIYLSAKTVSGVSDSPYIEMWSRTAVPTDQAWRIWNNSANQLIFWPRINSGELRIRNAAGSQNNVILAGETGNITSTGTVEGATLTEGGNAVPNSTDHLGFFGGTTVAELAAELTDENYDPGSETSVEGVIDLADIQEKDIDSLTGQSDIDTEFVFDGVEVDFNAGTANAWPKLLSESTPTGTDCDVAAEYGRLLFDPDQDTEGSVMVCTSAGWKDVDDDGGAGGFTSFDIDGDNNSPQTITDGQEALFVGGVGIATTAAVTDQVTFDFAYADTLAGNPAFNAKECVFVTEGTSGGGFLCEGTTANTNEQLYLFPALDGADTSTFIALGASDGDALAGDSASSFFDAGVIEVAYGGTGLSAGTSGGVLYYSADATLASSALLAANQLMLGGGAGVAPSTLAAGTQYQVLQMGASDPAYGALNLAQGAAVTGVLPNANVAQDLTLSLTASAADEAYDATNWNADTAPAQKDDIRDQFEAEPAATRIFTNKTYDAESTGNVLTIPSYISIPVAVCTDDSTGAATVKLPTTNPGEAGCDTETNGRQRAYIALDGATQEYFQYSFRLPPNWTGDVDVEAWWSTDAVSGTLDLQIETACYSPSDPHNGSFNTADPFTADTADTTADDDNVVANANITMTGCAADDMFTWRISRDVAGGDTINANDVDIHEIRFVIRNIF